jgi:hypothetical protein
MPKSTHDVFALVMNFLEKIACLNTLQLVYSKKFNIKANISKNFAIPFKTIWFDKKDPCLC